MQARQERDCGRQIALTRMSRAKRFGLAALVALCVGSLLGAASAQAANVIVGSPLTGTFTTSACGVPCTVANISFPEAGANVTSPVSGAIVNWHLLKGTAGKNYKLRVLTPGGGTSYTGAGTSAAASPVGTGTEVFPTNLPIKAGQTIGIDLETGALIGIAASPGAGYAYWSPPVAEGSSASATLFPGSLELAFNAEVQPAPTISSISPSSGSFTGGTGIVISGTDFANVKSVSFGSTPAQSYGVGSAGQITAIAPAAAGPGPVNVSVTTIAGTTATSAASQFTYTACVVPKVQGKSLKASRKTLLAAGCALGSVKGHKSKSAKVVKQNPKPGQVLAPGSTVNVQLSKPKAKHRKPKPGK